MALYFEGTSTGNKYEVGKTYEMGGREYTAQSDGSFVREGTRTGFTTDSGKVVRENDGGHRTVGSSESGDVAWYASGSDAAANRTLSPGQSVQGASLSGTTGGNGGPPSGAVRVGNNAVARFFAASGGGYAARAAWSGKDDPAQDNLMAGFHIRANPKWTNAALQEERYGEFGSELIGLGILASDIGYTARINWDEYTTPRGGKPSAAAGAAEDLGNKFVNTVLSGMTMVEEWGKQNARREAISAQIGRQLDEAYQARDELQAAEWERIRPRTFDENISSMMHRTFGMMPGGGGW